MYWAVLEWGLNHFLVSQEGSAGMAAVLNELVPENWMAERSRQAMNMLHETVDIDQDLMKGVPVLKGTRFPISQLLAEIAEGRSVDQIAKAFRLNLELIKDLLHGLALHLDRPALK